MDSRLTIVLTLKDRPEFTRRWMRFMNAARCPYKILIADGGGDRGIQCELESATSYPDLDYEYIRYPYDRDLRAFYAKQLDVCARVSTEYVLLADNDDLYLVGALPQLLDFLDATPSYVGCRGTIAQFSLLSETGKVMNSTVGRSYRAVLHRGASIEAELPVDRVQLFLNGLVHDDHWKNWYCVYRRNDLVDSLRTVFGYGFADAVLNEILFLMLLLRAGKVRVLETLYYARQAGTSQGEAEVIATNNVLEGFLINDAFPQFSAFVRAEGIVDSDADYVRVLKALARYVASWCNLFPDLYHPPGLLRRLEQTLRAAATGNAFVHRVVYPPVMRFSHVLRGTRTMRAIRLPSIEPFVLTTSSDVPDTDPTVLVQ